MNPNAHRWTFGHSVNGIQRTYRRESPHKLPAKFLKSRCVAAAPCSDWAAGRGGKYSPAAFPVNRTCQRLSATARRAARLATEGAHYSGRTHSVNDLQHHFLAAPNSSYTIVLNGFLFSE
jgi:hypothetical protein